MNCGGGHERLKVEASNKQRRKEMEMRTVIERDSDGSVSLVVDGEEAPMAVGQEYLQVRDLLFPPQPGVVADEAPKPKLKVREVASGTVS